MTDTILALIPSYGHWVIFFTVALACLAIPLPASMLVVASGSFAASGDIDLYSAMASALVGYLIGDQTAFRAARFAGVPLIEHFRSSERTGRLIERTERLLEKHGIFAILLSRTILSPLGPWMSYLCGAIGVKWHAFTVASLTGATIWVATYCLMGYYFADRIYDLATLTSSGIGFLLAFAAAIMAALWLRSSWHRYSQQQTGTNQQQDNTDDITIQPKEPHPERSQDHADPI